MISIFLLFHVIENICIGRRRPVAPIKGQWFRFIGPTDTSPFVPTSNIYLFHWISLLSILSTVFFNL